MATHLPARGWDVKDWTLEDMQKHIEYLKRDNRWLEKRYLDLRKIEDERDNLQREVTKLKAQIAYNRQHSPLVQVQKPTVPINLRRTSYRWRLYKDRSWRIGYGASNFLVATGAPWSNHLGRAFFMFLTLREKTNIKKGVFKK
jgi:hypothetical protein